MNEWGSLCEKKWGGLCERHRLLQHGVDCAVIALWLGHESVETTYIYLHADLQMKEKALATTTPVNMRPNRYKPDDQVLAFLKSL